MDKVVKSKEDFEEAFHSLNLCTKKENQQTPNGREESRHTNR